MTANQSRNRIKKTLFIISICIAAVLAAGYLIYYFSTPYLHEVSPYTRPQSNLISVQLEKTRYPTSTQTIPLRISNNRSDAIVYTHSGLEKQVDGIWHTLKFRPYEATANQLVLEQNEVVNSSARLDRYGPRLKPGHYRWVTNIHSPNKGYVAVEFDIVSSSNGGQSSSSAEDKVDRITKIDLEETYPEVPATLDIVYNDVESILADADVVIKGDVIRQEIIPLDGFPQTHTTMDVTTVLKGNIESGNSIVVIEEGGKDGCLIAGIPQLSPDYNYYLMLKEHEGSYYVCGAFQGRFIEREGYVFQQATEDVKLKETYTPMSAKDFETMVLEQLDDGDLHDMNIGHVFLSQFAAESVVADLTTEELDTFNEMFSPFLYDKQGAPIKTNPWACFLTSYYSDAKDMNFAEFLCNFPSDGSQVSAAEFEALKSVDSWPYAGVEALENMPVPIHKYPAQYIDSALKEHADITTDDLDTSDVAYLAEYDAYYNYTSDFAVGMHICTRGEKRGNTIFLYEELEHGTDLLILREEDDSYKIVSLQHIER